MEDMKSEHAFALHRKTAELMDDLKQVQSSGSNFPITFFWNRNACCFVQMAGTQGVYIYFNDEYYEFLRLYGMYLVLMIPLVRRTGWPGDL